MSAMEELIQCNHDLEEKESIYGQGRAYGGMLMDFVKYDLSRLEGGREIEVELSAAANVKMLN